MADSDPPPALLAAPDRTDPGDDTFRRFRYQAAYAAVLALQQLDDDGEVVEVYCEQHEDILLRLRTGRFRGVQVKTRDDGGAQLRGTDDPILDALLGFVELDLRFPDAFEGFVLATNAAFDRTGKGRGNLHNVTEQARAFAADASRPCAQARQLADTLVTRFAKKAKAVAKQAKSLAKNAKPSARKGKALPRAAAGAPATPALTPVATPLPALPATIPIGAALKMLARLDLNDSLPKLADMRSRIRERLIQISPKVKGSTFVAADRVVDELELSGCQAASRIDQDRNGRLWFLTDPIRRAAIAVRDEIRAKCLARSTVESIINKHCAGTLLVTADISPRDVPPDLTLVERKLVLGGLSAGTVSVARDAIASAEEYGAQLLYVHDAAEGARRVDHVRAVAKKEAQLAYETQAADGEVNGRKMLADVEARLRRRRTEDASGVLANFQDEHLLGHVFALTGECTVWWSLSRELGEMATAEPAKDPVDG